MSKLKIGVTEAGDAGLDLSWVEKIDSVDAAIIITKQLTRGCRQALVDNKEKCILHATITGYGKTVLEPNVLEWKTSIFNLSDFVRDADFPRKQVVIRVDPIIPTPKGIATAREVINLAALVGFRRFRVSVIDMYKHVRERFVQANLPLPYLDGFAPTQPMLNAVDEMLAEARRKHIAITFESCAENLQNAKPVGCVSATDLEILGIPHDEMDEAGPQKRAGCRCYSGKTELLSNRHPCGHQCLYCYWR